MRIFGIIPCLYDQIGHHFSYHEAVHRALAEKQIEYVQILPKDSVSEPVGKYHKILYRLKSKKSFSNNFFKSFLNVIPLYRFIRNAKVNKDDAIFIEYFVVMHLAALLFLALLIRKPIRLLILYRSNIEQMFLNGKLHKLLHRCLSLINPKGIRLCTDSELLQEHLTSFFQYPVSVLPIPHIGYFFNKRYKKLSTVQCWWPGGSTRAEKGLDFIINFCKGLSESDQITVIVAKNLENIISPNKWTDFVPSHLTGAEYRKTMRQADLILLPYARENYQFRTSGIFVEAIAYVKIPLVTAGTWMAKELMKYDLGELVIEEWTTAGLIDKILFTVNDDAINKKIKIMRKAYSKYHSLKGFGRVFTRLLDLQHCHNCSLPK